MQKVKQMRQRSWLWDLRLYTAHTVGTFSSKGNRLIVQRFLITGNLWYADLLLSGQGKCAILSLHYYANCSIAL